MLSGGHAGLIANLSRYLDAQVLEAILNPHMTALRHSSVLSSLKTSCNTWSVYFTSLLQFFHEAFLVAVHADHKPSARIPTQVLLADLFGCNQRNRFKNLRILLPKEKLLLHCRALCLPPSMVVRRLMTLSSTSCRMYSWLIILVLGIILKHHRHLWCIVRLNHHLVILLMLRSIRDFEAHSILPLTKYSRHLVAVHPHLVLVHLTSAIFWWV